MFVVSTKIFVDCQHFAITITFYKADFGTTSSEFALDVTSGSSPQDPNPFKRMILNRKAQFSQ